MAGPAHPHAMSPKKPGRTRTAPPKMPSSWWSAPGIRTYLLFDATGFVYLLFGFVALHIVWVLGGKSPEDWNALMLSMKSPLYAGFHLLALVSTLFVAVRFFRLFPKAQPVNTGLPMPPTSVIHATLYVAWAVVTLVLTLILMGVIF